LIAKGADVNLKINNVKTALMMATKKGYANIIKILNTAGAKE
jgi:ankyrin repeat protein